MTKGRVARRKASAGTGEATATSAVTVGTSSASARSGRRHRHRSVHYWSTATSRTAGCSEPRLRARVLGAISRGDEFDTPGASMGARQVCRARRVRGESGVCVRVGVRVVHGRVHAGVHRT